MVDRSGYQGNYHWGSGGNDWWAGALVLLILVIFALAIHELYACLSSADGLRAVLRCFVDGL